MFDINVLFILIMMLGFALLLLKPVRSLIIYFAKNIPAVILYILISLSLSGLGLSLSVNIFTLAAAALLGIPGISLALFLNFII